LLQIVLLYVYLVGTIRTQQDLRFVMTWLLCGLVLEALIIVGLGVAGEGVDLGFLRGRVDASTGAWDETARFAGTVGAPNNAAEYLEILLAPAVAVLCSGMGRYAKALAALGLVLGAAALIGTMSRGGWMAAALSVAIVCVALWRRGRLRLAVPMLVAG